jgi:hypothetical protein
MTINDTSSCRYTITKKIIDGTIRQICVCYSTRRRIFVSRYNNCHIVVRSLGRAIHQENAVGVHTNQLCCFLCCMSVVLKKLPFFVLI